MDRLIEFGDIIARHLWTVSCQVSILTAIIGVVSLMAQKISAEFQYWLWMIVLARFCIPIGLSLPTGFDLYPLLSTLDTVRWVR